MINRQQINQTPISYALGYNTRKNSSKAKSYLQVNQLSNQINPTQEAVPTYMNDINNNSFAPAFSDPFGVPLGQNIQTFIPSQPNSGIVYYGDLDQQTCTSLRTFTKEPKEKHCCILVFNFLFYAGLTAGLVLMVALKLPIFTIPQIIAVPYLLYFCFGFCSHSFKQYFDHMKPYSHIEGIYQQLRQRTGHIKFTAECYHFTGGKHRRKVVTHTASQMIPVRECIDSSENLAQLKENNSYLFCKIKKYYYFGDPNSQSAFLNTYAMFTNSNRQDTYQIFTHTLDITVPDFADEIGLSVSSDGRYLKPMYIICLILGFGWLYLMMVQCRSQRYSINLIKRLTL